MFLNLHPRQIQVPCIAGSASRCQAVVMVEKKEKPFNIFQKVAIRKTRYKNILEKSVLGKLSFLTSWPHETTAGGNSRKSICHFVLFLNLVVKP